MIEVALNEWERSDDPQARRVARCYRKLMRDTDRAMKALEEMGNPLRKVAHPVIADRPL
ncbi:hypothetical protein PANO111632_21255 [Paracoccus nototheniae]|uniref:hypothetical protein n=1 Tax=Paracoccus nototheniae TaxID=2489002 RepID=UPI0013F3C7A3|nr:hypothetical protein [Paracoccus nototheniae]